MQKEKVAPKSSISKTKQKPLFFITGQLLVTKIRLFFRLLM